MSCAPHPRPQPRLPQQRHCMPQNSQSNPVHYYYCLTFENQKSLSHSSYHRGASKMDISQALQFIWGAQMRLWWQGKKAHIRCGACSEE